MKRKIFKSARRAGGLARAAAMSPQDRSAVARKAAEARWSKSSQDSREVSKAVIESEISKSGAPEYIVHKSEATKEGSFVTATGNSGDKSITVTPEVQWRNFNSDIDIKAGKLIVFGSQLRHPALIRAAYDYFVRAAVECSTQSKSMRWATLEFTSFYNKVEIKPNLGVLVLDNAHLDMEAKKYTLLQDYIQNDNLTRIVIVHGCDPLKYAFETLRHVPDSVFHISVRDKALKSIYL